MSVASFPRLARYLVRSSRSSYSTASVGTLAPSLFQHQQRHQCDNNIYDVTNKNPAFSFHTTAKNFMSESEEDAVAAKDDLMDILSREHAEEMENESTAMPEELKELQKDLTTKGGWKLVDGPDSGLVKLIKTGAGSAGLKVQVSFHCQDTVESADEEENYEEMDEATEEEEEEDVEPSMPIRFTVMATKAGQSMVFSCLSEHATAQIQSVALCSTATGDEEMEILNTGTVPSSNYQGPEFFELAQDLQASYQQFLETDLQINEDVASFIAMYSDYKEQSQYVKFLEGCQKILS